MTHRRGDRAGLSLAARAVSKESRSMRGEEKKREKGGRRERGFFPPSRLFPTLS